SAPRWYSISSISRRLPSRAPVPWVIVAATAGSSAGWASAPIVKTVRTSADETMAIQGLTVIVRKHRRGFSSGVRGVLLATASNVHRGARQLCQRLDTSIHVVECAEGAKGDARRAAACMCTDRLMGQ